MILGRARIGEDRGVITGIGSEGTSMSIPQNSRFNEQNLGITALLLKRPY